MSIEHIDALVRSAEHDRALARELRQAGSLPSLVRIGAARGYDFTADELTTYFARMEADELSDQELELGRAAPAGWRVSRTRP